MMQAGFLGTAIRTTLNCHSEAAVRLYHCLAKGDWSCWSAAVGIAGSSSVGNDTESCRSSALCRGRIYASMMFTWRALQALDRDPQGGNGVSLVSKIDDRTVILFLHLIDLSLE